MSEQQVKQNPPIITSVAKTKHPRRVEAGKRLATISRQAKERKARERFLKEQSNAQQKEETSEEQSNQEETGNSTLKYVIILGLIGSSVLMYM